MWQRISAHRRLLIRQGTWSRRPRKGDGRAMSENHGHDSHDHPAHDHAGHGHPAHGHAGHEHGTQDVAAPHGEQAWDERYRTKPEIWSGNANVALVAEAAGLNPGTALDAGAGE